MKLEHLEAITKWFDISTEPYLHGGTLVNYFINLSFAFNTTLKTFPP